MATPYRTTAIVPEPKREAKYRIIKVWFKDSNGDFSERYKTQRLRRFLWWAWWSPVDNWVYRSHETAERALERFQGKILEVVKEYY